MERIVETLAVQMRQRGLSTRVMVPDDKGGKEIQHWMAQSGVPAELLAPLRHSFHARDLPNRRDLAALLGRQEGNLVNLHYGLNHIPPSDVLAVRRAGKRCVVSLHGAWPVDVLSQRTEMRRTRRAAALCDRVVVVCDFLQQGLLRAGVAPDKVRLIPCGVPPPQGLPARDDARRRLGLPEGAFVIATAARLDRSKGVDVVVEAVARLPQDGPATWLIVAGEGDERVALTLRARDRLGSRAVFFGLLSDLSDFYAAADVLAHGSYAESFGLVYVEAAFHGKPSVGTRVGATPETVAHGRTGLLVPPGDPVAMAEALQTLRIDSLVRALMGQAARDRAWSEFTDRRMADRYLEVLR